MMISQIEAKPTDSGAGPIPGDEHPELQTRQLLAFCPPGLSELNLSSGDLLSMWEATPLAHLRSISKLQLTFADELYVPTLAAMTALESLHLATSAVPAAIGDAVPSLTRLTRLTRLVFWADVSPYSRQAYALQYYGLSRSTRRAQLRRLLRKLSALPLLRHLQLGGMAFGEVQVLEGTPSFPVLEVLNLNMVVQADDQLLTLVSNVGTLAVVEVAKLAVQGNQQQVSEFRKLMAQRIRAAVSVKVHIWLRRKR